MDAILAVQALRRHRMVNTPDTMNIRVVGYLRLR